MSVASGYTRKIAAGVQADAARPGGRPADILAMHPSACTARWASWSPDGGGGEVQRPIHTCTPVSRSKHRLGTDDRPRGRGCRTGRVRADGERRKARKQAQRLAGEYHGGPRPFGFESRRCDGTAGRGRAYPAGGDGPAGRAYPVLAGGRLERIAGVRTSSGARWVPASFPGYWSGHATRRLIEHEGQIIGNAVWPALISEDELRAVRAVLRNPARKVSPGPARSTS